MRLGTRLFRSSREDYYERLLGVLGALRVGVGLGGCDGDTWFVCRVGWWYDLLTTRNAQVYSVMSKMM